MNTPSPRILVVDDSASNRLALRQTLTDFGVEIIEADSGVRALELAQSGDFAVVLLDVHMPELDGFEVARQLRAFGRTASTPVIFVTAAFTEPEHERYGYTLGAADYIINKPADPHIVRQKVAVFLQLYRERAELRQQMEMMARENQQLFLENEQFRVAQEDMKRRATHDPLTDLPNRALFEDRLRQAMQRAQRASSRFALVYVDLDNLKEMNDQYGHAAGDDLLIGVARRLVAAVRGSDTVARLGGDEFGLLLEGLDAAWGSSALGDKVYAAIHEEMTLKATLNGKPVTVVPGASIGVAVYPDHAQEADELLMLADLAMYRVKQRGGSAVQVYDAVAEGLP